nr:MAG TPA: hypothetical protein [Caudoviricetes sp.]
MCGRWVWHWHWWGWSRTFVMLSFDNSGKKEVN